MQREQVGERLQGVCLDVFDDIIHRTTRLSFLLLSSISHADLGFIQQRQPCCERSLYMVCVLHFTLP